MNSECGILHSHRVINSARRHIISGQGVYSRASPPHCSLPFPTLDFLQVPGSMAPVEQSEANAWQLHVMVQARHSLTHLTPCLQLVVRL